jgi:glycosyltransferase involved in cell wall biosynthesis
VNTLIHPPPRARFVGKTTVLHVLEAVEAGVSRHIANMVRHVDARHIVVLPQERVGGLTDTAVFDAIDAAGAEVIHLEMRRAPADHRNAAAIRRVHGLIRSTRPAIVHGHSAIGGAVARLAAVGTRAATVYTPHGIFPSRCAQALERALGRRTDRLVAMSESEAQLARRLRMIEPERIVVIPNGIDVTERCRSGTDLRTALGIPATAPLVGAVARLAAQKAPEVFLEACARVAAGNPTVRFVLIGDGPLAGRVQGAIDALGLHDRLVWVRTCISAEALTGQFDVFALPSRYEAGAPYAVMEAMRAEVPVVLTDVVGNRDAVRHEQTGLVVPPDDPGALATAIERLLADAQLRRRLAKAARADLEDRYDIERWGEAVASLYQSLR